MSAIPGGHGATQRLPVASRDDAPSRRGRRSYEDVVPSRGPLLRPRACPPSLAVMAQRSVFPWRLWKMPRRGGGAAPTRMSCLAGGRSCAPGMSANPWRLAALSAIYPRVFTAIHIGATLPRGVWERVGEATPAIVAKRQHPRIDDLQSSSSAALTGSGVEVNSTGL
jgi:hypothetical protein